MQGFTRITDRLSDADLRAVIRDIVSRFRWGTFAWDPASIAANATASTTFTTADSQVFSGLRTGQHVTLTAPVGLSGALHFRAEVATDDTLTVHLTNTSAGAIDAASGTWSIFGVLF